MKHVTADWTGLDVTEIEPKPNQHNSQTSIVGRAATCTAPTPHLAVPLDNVQQTHEPLQPTA